MIDIQCENSLAFTDNPCDQVDKEIWIGTKGSYTYWSYLYFNLMPIAHEVTVTSAVVVLFKIPVESKVNEWDYYEANRVNRYRVLPLLDYVSPYAYCYPELKVDYKLEKEFQIREEVNYTEVDITEIVKAWLGRNLENKGIFLTGLPSSKWLLYGSELASSKGLRPFLRVAYKTTPIPDPDRHEPIVELPISIKILA